MKTRVDVSGGGDGHVHKLPPKFFKYDNVGCYTINSNTEDEKPNEHDYPSSLNDTFVGVEQGAGVEDGIGGTKNYGGAGGFAFGGPSHDPFLAALSHWILPCAGRKLRFKPFYSYNPNAKIVLEKRKGKDREREQLETDSRSSFDEDSGEGPISHFPNFWGETSKVISDYIVGGKLVVDLSGGLTELFLGVGSGPIEDKGKIGSCQVQSKDNILDQDNVALAQANSSQIHNGSFISGSVGEASTFVQETCNEGDLDSISNQSEEGELTSSILLQGKTRRNKVRKARKRHGMVTRRDKSEAPILSKAMEQRKSVEGGCEKIWNLRVKLAKVIEKGVELGLLNSSNDGVGRKGLVIACKLGEWILDEEVAKVIETGLALGFDFNGEKMSISEEILTMEKEDVDRFVAMKERQ
ncbi:hypothetical protein LWI29_000415 [Acer saccharum]|uniref:Uncharacterized protein n=1 Tax=Acer saccharum TaxID=4024 RepID=A0AA39T696_ACESA|nr:hypothetical protein LWI29_000415 [Acer saccharum]